MRRLVVLLGEGKVKRTYPESLCCSNSREPRSEDGELHDEYIDIYLLFCLFVGLSFGWNDCFLSKEKKNKKKEGKARSYIYI